MSEPPNGLELWQRPSSPTDPEELRPSPPFQLLLPSQDPGEGGGGRTGLWPELRPSPLPEHQLGEEAKPACSNPRRPLVRLVVGICSCAAVLGLVYYIYLHSGGHSRAVPPCLSPACQSTSALLSTSADPFTRPCDYFLFSCSSGGRDRKRLDRRGSLRRYLREILESDDGSRSSAVQKARRFYRSCLDTRSIETAGAEPFLTLIQNLGGWAVSGQWNQTGFNSTLSVLMRDYSTFPFFRLSVGEDVTDADSSRKYIQVDQPDRLIPTEWNNKTSRFQVQTLTLRPFLASYQKYLALLGAPLSSNMVHVGTFISLSSELAVAAAPVTHRLSGGKFYQRMTIRELQSRAPAVDWLGCLQAFFHPLPITEDEPILVHNVPYIVKMSAIIGQWLNKHELSTSGPLQTYMILNLLHTMMPALDSRFSEATNNDRVGPRWKRCVTETEAGFDLVLAYLLRQRTGRREVDELIQNVLSSFKSKLHELQWTDEKSLRPLVEKVQSLVPRLQNTNEIPGETELDKLFSKVSVSSHSFFSNYVQLLSMWPRRHRKLLAEDSDGRDALSVRPRLLGKALIFPVGMFVPPLFHATHPRAVNYGVTAFLIAKDILHLLLPDISCQSEAVRAVGECVWAQYRAVTHTVDQTSSLSAGEQQQEVWVQYSALQIALQAYHQSLRNQPGDSSIAGFSLTRLFLTSFSQMNCDSDQFSEFMPFEPSFLVTAVCANSPLCPTSLRCPNKPRQQSLKTC